LSETRVVPTGEEPMPFVWATGDDHATVEETVRTLDGVLNI